MQMLRGHFPLKGATWGCGAFSLIDAAMIFDCFRRFMSILRYQKLSNGSFSLAFELSYLDIDTIFCLLTSLVHRYMTSLFFMVRINPHLILIL